MFRNLKLLFFLLLIFVNICIMKTEEVQDDAVEDDIKDAKKVESAEQSDEPATGEYTDSTVTSNEADNGKKEDDKNVVTLTKDNFESFINDNEIVLVEFFAPWCGHCKSLAPEYESAAKVLKENKPPVLLGAVDATVESDLASRFDVSGYPTLKFFKKGVAVDYDGPRVKDGIVEYMKERADPEWKLPPEAVLTLTKDNFTDIVNKEPLMLVEFYAPWCGHCKKLAPEYEKAAKSLKNYDPPIPLAKVDATVESDIASKYDVTGYPTLKLFRKGKPSDYKGERNEIGITDYMQRQVGPSSKLLPTKKAVMTFVKEWDDVVIMGFFDNEDDKMLTDYLEANNDIRDEYRFGHTFDVDARKAFGFNKNTIALIQPENFRSKYEEKYVVFKGDSSKSQNIQKFYDDNVVPLVGQLTNQNEEKRYKKRPLVMVFYGVDFSFEHREGTQYWRSKVVEVANDYRDFTFVIADEEDYADRLKDFGLDDSGEDVNVALFGEKDKKYKMEEEFSEDSLRDFLDSYKNNELEPVIKSQPVPKGKSGPVQVVVGSNFEEIVMDQTKDVLIELYAPWCGHCKALEPTYKKLAQKYKDESNLVIAKMDATANDVPAEYEASGFPTIYFAPKDSKSSPEKYDGARELSDFVKFLEEKSTVLSSKKKLKEEL
ncbi:protein disulfide-isomerase A4-like isoform X2 [Xenia sp. Carnegie-2017]|uniref:protein disulfide-isomerase A4-like isoform X1 n=1 Tax=Xenia sp. Carnegie-2017 TaxID=2897299 RepID=UPI001F049174|nr:protein disulfide-isomerase A4-like isoform X1 [Xenia sp. Carnegie-2017]XP_046846985.1 protein disulfide-isomerase A4-like isoform X2 [Xenia sp. Carnegie-2017]